MVGLPPADRAQLGGATGARLNADIVISDIGEQQQISAPPDGSYRPIQDLFLTLNDLGVPIPLRLRTSNLEGEAQRNVARLPRPVRDRGAARRPRPATRSCSSRQLTAAPREISTATTAAAMSTCVAG